MKLKNVYVGQKVGLSVGGCARLAKIINFDMFDDYLNTDIQFPCGKTAWVSYKDLKEIK